MIYVNCHERINMVVMYINRLNPAFFPFIQLNLAHIAYCDYVSVLKLTSFDWQYARNLKPNTTY